MNTYKHILLAVDFSHNTDYLVKHTFEMGLAFSANISIVHVLDNIPMPDTSYGTIIAMDYETEHVLLEQQKTALNDVGKKLNVPEGQRWLVWGSPKDEIIALAKKERVDLIVVGSHGRHGLALLFGSTANGVLHYAPCDVLAVKLPDE